MIGKIDNLFNLLNDFFQKKEIKTELHDISEIAGYLWMRGWAERNAGNFSINVTTYFTEKELERFSSYPFFPLKKEYPALGNNLLMVSGAGSRMRKVANHPVDHLCFIYLSSSGAAYHILSNEKEGEPIKPTSELAVHLAIHQMLLQKKRSEKVVLHAHVTELIALTQLPAFTTGEYLNDILCGMHPETLTFLPDGIGFIPYTLPGTEKIAQATLQVLSNHQLAVWEKHGCLSLGINLAEAFENLDLVAKAAQIYFLSKSSGMEPEGLTDNQLQEIKEQNRVFLMPGNAT